MEKMPNLCEKKGDPFDYHPSFCCTTCMSNRYWTTFETLEEIERVCKERQLKCRTVYQILNFRTFLSENYFNNFQLELARAKHVIRKLETIKLFFDDEETASKH